MSIQNDGDATVRVVFLLIMFTFATIAICMEANGIKREPTNKSKLCSCVIHVDSVPVPEDIVEGV